MILTDENGFWNNKKASINIPVVSLNDNVSFSYFANVKHTQNEFHVDSSVELTLPKLLYPSH